MSGRQIDIEKRKEQLYKMLAMLRENEAVLCAAQKQDLNKPEMETFAHEVHFHTLIARWAFFFFL